MRKLKRVTALAAASALALTLAACGNGDEDNGDNGTQNGETDTDTDESDTDEADTDNGAADGAGGEITIAYAAGWEDGTAAGYVWNYILQEQGYDVSMESAEPAVVFTGIDAGEYDVSMVGMLPTTHEDYIAQYPDLEDLGMWYEEAELTIAVNEDAPIDSLAELADNADEMGGRIVGIESGAGLTRITQDEIIPAYGLEDMEFVISSTPAMLAELQSATDSGDNVVVTLWHPHWAYDAFPVRDLEDPENAFGDPDNLHFLGRPGFIDEEPELAELFDNFYMSHEDLTSLQNIMFNELDGDDHEGAVERWIEENPDFVDSVING